MRLAASSAEAQRLQVPREFPSRASAGGVTRIMKWPYVDDHLPQHPGFDRTAPPPGPVHHPVAYLVRQEPHSTIDAHFHRVDQFQVFVRGTGRFGNRPVKGCVVQYANAYSTYGPIVAGAQGIDYLTIRTQWDKGAWWMPQSRDELQRHPGRKLRNLVYPCPPRLATEQPVAHCLGSDADGLGAWQVILPARSHWGAPAPAGRGQFLVVLQGSITLPGGERLPALSVVYNSREEAALRVASEEDPAALLLLQFPSAE